MQLLADYTWPGNVRELENVIERAVVLCRGDTLTVEDLPEVVIQASEQPRTALSVTIGTPLEEIESRLIRETLRHTKGDKSLAAQLSASRRARSTASSGRAKRLNRRASSTYREAGRPTVRCQFVTARRASERRASEWRGRVAKPR